jgi:hypothetical protein
VRLSLGETVLIEAEGAGEVLGVAADDVIAEEDLGAVGDVVEAKVDRWTSRVDMRPMARRAGRAWILRRPVCIRIGMPWPLSIGRRTAMAFPSNRGLLDRPQPHFLCRFSVPLLLRPRICNLSTIWGKANMEPDRVWVLS